jgi:hypothetical protein
MTQHALTPVSAELSALDYTNSAIVERIAEKYHGNLEVAQQVFEDTKRFLFLCGTQKTVGFLLSPPPEVDVGWHEFILFTEAYTEYCVNNFGRYIHHRPTAVSDKNSTYTHDFKKTSDLAKAVFGDLSSNWVTSQDKCGIGGCSTCTDV